MKEFPNLKDTPRADKVIPMGSIGCSVGLKLNLGNYETVDFSSWITVSCDTTDPEKVEEALKYAKQVVYNDLEAQANDFRTGKKKY